MELAMVDSEEFIDRICQGLENGLSLVQVCKQANMPSRATVLRWMREKPEIESAIARAREEQADYLADELIAIADDESLTPESRKVMINTRQWAASKLKPKKYGDRQIVDQNVTVSLVDLVTASMKTVEHAPPLAVTVEPKPTKPAIAPPIVDNSGNT
jgi:hypothetical protein